MFFPHLKPHQLQPTVRKCPESHNTGGNAQGSQKKIAVESIDW